MSDHPLPGVSTHDPLALISALRDLERVGVRVSGVLTAGVEASHSAAAVCEEFGLPGVGVQVAERATDKLARLQALHAAGVSCPRFGFARELKDARSVAGELGYPVVLKPTRRTGAQGVVRCSDPAELEAAWRIARAESSDGVLVEEFLEGSEHSSESLVVDGAIHTTGFQRPELRHEAPLPALLSRGRRLAPKRARPAGAARDPD